MGIPEHQCGCVSQFCAIDELNVSVEPNFTLLGDTIVFSRTLNVIHGEVLATLKTVLCQPSSCFLNL